MWSLARVRGRTLLLGTIVLGCTMAPVAGMIPASAGSTLCDALAARDGSAHVAVLSAFPAELAPLVAQADVRERVEVDGHAFYVGELADMRVVLTITEIGIVNATTTTEILLTHFDIVGIVFSGVAGSQRLIGDVLVPARWVEQNTGSVFAVNPVMLEVARHLKGGVKLERCTVRPSGGPTVCIEGRPRIRIGGVGQSGDPLGGAPFQCQPGGGEVFGCELPEPATRAEQRETMPAEPVAVDMETAAVARVAAAHGVPYLAFRAVSDGAGDPLGLPGFPAQFFAYYRLAAHNAAVGAVAFLKRVVRLGDGGRHERPLCRRLARSQ